MVASLPAKLVIRKGNLQEHKISEFTGYLRWGQIFLFLLYFP